MIEFSIPDQLLADALVEKRLFSREDLEKLILSNQQSMTDSHSQIAGILYRIDRRRQSLLIQESLSLCTLAEIPLFENDDRYFPFEPDEWQSWGNGIAILDAHGEISQWLDWTDNAPFGLVSTETNAYVYTPNISKEKSLAISQDFLYGLKPFKDSPSTAFDLYFSPKRDYLFVTNRFTGKVFVINTSSYQKEQVLNIRPPGSLYAINLSIDSQNGIVFITDQVTANLYTWDIKLNQLDSYHFEAHHLGNHLVDSSRKKLFLLAFLPEVHLLSIHLDSLEVEQMLSLEVECFSIVENDPCDLLTMSLEKDLILLSSFSNEDENLPCLNIIDLEHFSLKKDIPLKREFKPVLLTQIQDNPIFPYKKILGYLLLESHLISDQLLQDIENSIEYSTYQEGFNQTGLTYLDSSTDLVEQIENSDDIDARNSEESHISFSSLHALPAGYLPIPDPKRSRIFVINQNRFVIWQLTQTQTVMKCPVDFIFVNDSLFFVDLELNQIVECHKDGSTRWMLSSENHPHLELFNPAKITAYYHHSEIHLLVVDKGNHRVIDLKKNHEITWQIGTKGISGQTEGYLSFPEDVQMTPQGTVLIADTGNFRVLEFKDHVLIHEEKGFKYPIFVQRLNSGHTIILDSGQFQILEFDEQWNEVNSTYYYYPGLSERYKISKPTKVILRDEKSIVLIDRDRLLEVSLWHGHILWFSFLEDCFIHTPDSTSNFEFNKIDLLKKVKYFENFSEKELQDVSELLVLKCYQEFEYIYQPGESLNHVLFIARGTVDTFNKNKQFLENYSAGSVLNEAALLNSSKRNTIAKASSYCEIYCLSLTDFQKMEIDIQGLKASLTHEQNLIGNASSSTVEIDQTKRLKELINSQKKHLDLLKSKRSSKSILVESKFDESLSSLSLWLLDKNLKEVNSINRKGHILKTFKNLKQPQFIYEKKDSVLITDSRLPGVIEISKKDLSILHRWSERLNLKNPRSAVPVTEDSILIADRHQLIEVNKEQEILWELKGKEFNPHFAQFIDVDRLLIVETHQHIVKEIDTNGRTLWTYGTSRVFGKKPGHLFLPEFAIRTDNETTIISDTQNHRLIEVDSEGKIIWTYTGSQSIRLIRPHFFNIMPNGHILIFFDSSRQIVEINKSGQVYWSFKQSDEQQISVESIDMVYSEIEQGLIDYAHSENYHCFEIHITLHPKCKMKSVRVSLIISKLDTHGTVIKTYPIPENLLNEELDLQFAISLITRASKETIQEILMSIAEVEDIQISSI